VNVGVGQGRPVVAGALVELKRRNSIKLFETRAALAMRRVTRSAGIGSANKSALELGVPIHMDSVILDALTA
jgi:hypothetical protein